MARRSCLCSRAPQPARHGSAYSDFSYYGCSQFFVVKSVIWPELSSSCVNLHCSLLNWLQAGSPRLIRKQKSYPHCVNGPLSLILPHTKPFFSSDYRQNIQHLSKDTGPMGYWGFTFNDNTFCVSIRVKFPTISSEIKHAYLPFSSSCWSVEPSASFGYHSN